MTASVPAAAGTEAGPNAIGATLGLLGDEWSLLIVRHALTGFRRYSQWQQALGIAPSVLSSRLKRLTEAAVLQRSGPDYVLSASGADLWPVLLCIWAWEQTWVPGQADALPVMRHRSCSSVFSPVLCCAACGSPCEAGDVDTELGPSGDMQRSAPTGSNRRRSGSRVEGPGLFAETMALIGSRWSSALLGSAFLGATRFSEFEAWMGAPPNMVAERLKSFVALGVLDDDYWLTAKGLAFFPTVSCFIAWGERWLPAPDGPALLARHRSCGQDYVPVLRCSTCDGVLRPEAIEVAAVSNDVLASRA